MYPNFLIILMFFSLFLYHKVKNYFTWRGFFLAIVVLISIYLRIRYVDIKHSNILKFSSTSFTPYLLSLVPTYIILKKDFSILKNRFRYFVKLLLLYFLFSIIQQFIFLFVVTDTLLFLSNNYYFTGIVSVIYYFLFHISYKGKLATFLPYLLVFSITNVFVYLHFDTILPQIIFHGIFGALLFTIGTDTDLLKDKF
jgi:hypothetical protein